MGVKVCPVIPLFTAHQQQAWAKFCLPGRIICDTNPQDGPIRKCEDTWNNIYCQTDEPFFMQFKRGDLIRFQTKFRDQWNPDPENPADGWDVFVRAKLYNNDTGQLISDEVNDFASRWVVGWNGKESIQIIEIDTTKPAFDNVTCWHIEFETYRVETDEEENETTIIDSTACTEDFCDCGECEDWPLLEAIVTGYDGHGYWHGALTGWTGTGNFTYSPAFRFPLEIVQTGNRNTRTVSERFDLDFQASKVFGVSTFTPVPPYVSNMLALGFLIGARLIFDSNMYDLEDTAYSRQITRTQMLTFTFEIYQHGKKQQREC